MFYLPIGIPAVLKTQDNTPTGIIANKQVTYSIKIITQI